MGTARAFSAVGSGMLGLWFSQPCVYVSRLGLRMRSLGQEPMSRWPCQRSHVAHGFAEQEEQAAAACLATTLPAEAGRHRAPGAGAWPASQPGPPCWRLPSAASSDSTCTPRAPRCSPRGSAQQSNAGQLAARRAQRWKGPHLEVWAAEEGRHLLLRQLWQHLLIVQRVEGVMVAGARGAGAPVQQALIVPHRSAGRRGLSRL